MQQTLVVVDMQVFETRAVHCIDSVVELICRFRATGDPIVILEYSGSGSTIYPVMDAVEGYDRILLEWPRLTEPLWTAATKESYDGSKESLKVCVENGWPCDFIVCGVAYNCCVQHTADSLAEQHPVEVALDCTDIGDNDWKGGSLVKLTRRLEEAA